MVLMLDSELVVQSRKVISSKTEVRVSVLRSGTVSVEYVPLVLGDHDLDLIDKIVVHER